MEIRTMGPDDDDRSNGALPPIYTLTQLVEMGPFGTTYLTAAVKDGRLRARKTGRYVLVTQADWLTFLDSFPSAVRSKESA